MLGFHLYLTPFKTMTTTITQRLFTIICLAATGISPLSAATWIGGGSTLWSDSANWSGGVPLNDWETATFASSNIGSVSHDVESALATLQFTNAGWSLAGSNFTSLKYLQSAGAGTNTVDMWFQVVTWGSADGTVAWTVGSGNTLAFAQMFYMNSMDINLTGGGTLQIGGTLNGWGAGAPKISINDNSTVKFTVANPFETSSAGFVLLNNSSARMQIAASVAATEAMIGGKIQDGTALGLSVTDIGGGYSEVSVVPEPSTCLLLIGAGALLVFAGRRLRKDQRGLQPGKLPQI